MRRINLHRIINQGWEEFAPLALVSEDAMRDSYCNMNDFAKIVTLREGKLRSTDIAQVKEVLRIARTLLRKTGIDIYKVVGATPKEVFRNVKW